MTRTPQEQLADYIRAVFVKEDEHLRSIKPRSAEAGFPQIHIRPEEGQLLQLILQMIGAKRVIEIGTLAGYSGMWMARALPEDGTLISIENNEEHADFARRVFDEAGLADRVDLRLGNALEILEALSDDAPFDAIFIDADKGSYLDYLDWAFNHIRAGGVVMAHNAFMGGRIIDPSQVKESPTKFVDAFNRRLADHPDFTSLIIPMGDGLVVGVRIA